MITFFSGNERLESSQPSSVRHDSGRLEALPSQTNGPNKKLTGTLTRRLSIRARRGSTQPPVRNSTTN